MPAAVYPLLLLLVVYVLGVTFFKSELFSHFLLLGFATSRARAACLNSHRSAGRESSPQSQPTTA